MKQLSSFSPLIDRYDAFLLDLWGVVHDGEQLYPGVRDTLVSLRRAGKQVIFLSNAPRRARKVAAVLTRLGVEPSLYDAIVSSGEAGFHWLEEGKAPWGKRYYFIGPQRDADVLHGLDFTPAETLEEADFLLNVGFGSEESCSEDLSPLLCAAQLRGLPMLCLNPDLEVIRMNGTREPCAGVLAKEYEHLGGSVTWFGKPYSAVYERCHHLLNGLDKTRILAVGDSLETDIPGAKRFGVDSALILGGILKGRTIADIEEECMALALRPAYLVPQFGI